MRFSIERNFATFGPWQAAATLASAVVALGLVIGWPAGQAEAEPASSKVQALIGRCTQGTEVSNFVCRNTWMANLKLAYR